MTAPTHYRARYYDPAIGRFISEDPLGFDGDGTNFYTYVGNDPADSVDAWGLKLCRMKLPGLGDAYVDDQFAPLIERWMHYNSVTGVNNVVFTEAFRTTAYQSALSSNRNAITPAKAGSSLHEAGFAVDISWRRLSPEQQAIVVLNAESVGLSWGGNFRKPDRVHFYHDPGNRRMRIKQAQNDRSTSRCNDQCSK